MTEFCALRAKAYAYLMDDDSEKKKAKGTKKCVIKRQLMFENYTDSLFNDKIISKSPQIFRSDHHNVCTVEINKIPLSSNDDKRLQTFNRVTKYPYRTNAIKVCESEILRVFEANMKLKMLSTKCESEAYVKEKEECEMFLKHVKTKCESEMRKYVKLKKC